jgi:putative peptidoglycan lipid II flippase
MSKNSALIRQVGLIVILTALAKIAAFGKDVLLSLQFGAGSQTDAYFIANAIPGFVFGGVFATISLVFLPAFKRAAFKSEYDASTTYRTAAIGYTVLNAFLGMITFIGASPIVSMLAPELPATTHDLAVQMTRIMAFSFVFSGWVGLQNAVLQTHKLLIWPQVAQILNHLFVIGGLAVAVMIDGVITLLVYAAVIGWIVLAPLVSLRAYKFWPRMRGRLFDKGVALSMAALSFPVLLSLTLDQSSILIGTYLGSFFPEGAISHLNYAQRLMVLLSSVFSLVIAYVLFPYLTESILANHITQARRFVALALIAVLLLSAPLMVLSIVMSDALISSVFQRGGFSAEDVIATGRVMALFAPIIVLAGVREVLNRLFLAWQQTKVLLLFCALSLAVNLMASFYFSRTIGLEGIALGATCGALAYVAAQILIILARHKNLLHRDLLPWITLITVATAISAITCQWLVGHVLIDSVRLDFLFKALAVVLVFAAAIFVPAFSFPRLREIYKKEQLA